MNEFWICVQLPVEKRHILVNKFIFIKEFYSKNFNLGALMRNSGILVANDANKDRAKAIIANTHRLGLTNTIVTNLDGRQFAEVN